jgi:hypothetical protein
MKRSARCGGRATGRALLLRAVCQLSGRSIRTHHNHQHMQAALDALHEYYTRSQAAAAHQADEAAALRGRMAELESGAAGADRARADLKAAQREVEELRVRAFGGWLGVCLRLVGWLVRQRGTSLPALTPSNQR